MYTFRKCWEHIHGISKTSKRSVVKKAYFKFSNYKQLLVWNGYSLYFLNIAISKFCIASLYASLVTYTHSNCAVATNKQQILEAQQRTVKLNNVNVTTIKLDTINEMQHNVP